MSNGGDITTHFYIKHAAIIHHFVQLIALKAPNIVKLVFSIYFRVDEMKNQRPAASIIRFSSIEMR